MREADELVSGLEDVAKEDGEIELLARTTRGILASKGYRSRTHL